MTRIEKRHELCENCQIENPIIYGIETPKWHYQADYKKRNIIRIAGYFPLVNIIVGVFLLIITAKMKSQNNRVDSGELNERSRNEHISQVLTRGLCTFLLGPVLLIIDIAATIINTQKLKSEENIDRLQLN